MGVEGATPPRGRHNPPHPLSQDEELGFRTLVLEPIALTFPTFQEVFRSMDRTPLNAELVTQC